MITLTWLIILGAILTALCRTALAIRRYEQEHPAAALQSSPDDRHPFDLMS